MRANVKGAVMPAPEFVEEGRETGYADLASVMQAFGVKLRQADGQTLVGLRSFSKAFGLPITYVAAEETVYIASAPLPPVPDEPVGAGVDPWVPVTATICGGPGDRRADLLDRIIQQFHVDRNPRHLPRDGNTYCNIFLWDVTRALGCEIPHWVVGNGEPSTVGRGRELDANGVVLWLRKHGPDFGWKRTGYGDALYAANAGRPAVMVWLNQGGIGHVAMVRPGEPSRLKGIPIAQAGIRNFDNGYETDGFGAYRIYAEFYVHD